MARVMAAGFLVLFFSGVSQAYHPLITDDAGTLGKGKLQVEFNHEFAHDSGNAEINLNKLQGAVTYGKSIPWM